MFSQSSRVRDTNNPLHGHLTKNIKINISPAGIMQNCLSFIAHFNHLYKVKYSILKRKWAPINPFVHIESEMEKYMNNKNLKNQISFSTILQIIAPKSKFT